MGVLNVTPDSFSDGGRYAVPEEALKHAWAMVEEGASIIDVGGESTRPGAADVSVDEELRRVVPVVEALTRELPVPVSVDTRRVEVMRRALAAGAGMINDINALQEPGAIAAVTQSDAAICLMHMQGQPKTMQQAPVYRDVVDEVAGYLCSRADACRSEGIEAERIVLDPGIGFGKTLAHNLALMRELPTLTAYGYPVLVGVSRKSLIGVILDGATVDQRLFGSVGGALAAALCGARLLRVHDVKATADALRVALAFTGVDEEAR
ncbi:dihydropteroate synthase [Acidihalobacter ferrooxydans]|uniref:Dihydropteroate synthase n=2 Tax=Acidihalobacter ferrooxydans TaxID=1765967 RepID=A0A1P8UJ49_9GAMM|nr:dihydropteroate synthase [Acidihalobacter ferrooxydans]APZ43869.1 dihydropteroate synthase [Acidihalobacter ferrooxydans]